MKSPAASDVLRDIYVHAEPRTLLRPRAAPAPQVRVVAASVAPVVDATAENRRAGYAEGFALGRAEGLCAGATAGERGAEARLEAATREAREAVREQASAQRAAEQAAFEAIANRLGRLQQEFRALAQSRIDSLESDAMALAFDAVCRIVGEDGDGGRRAAGVVRTALRSLRNDSLFRVRVNPDDLQTLRGSADGQALMSQPGAVEWLADATVEPGGCLLDTRQGSVDAGIETQVGRLRQTWAEAVHGVEPEEAREEQP